MRGLVEDVFANLRLATNHQTICDFPGLNSTVLHYTAPHQAAAMHCTETHYTFTHQSTAPDFSPVYCPALSMNLTKRLKAIFAQYCILLNCTALKYTAQ